MNLLFASDSFKGTLSSEKTADLLTKAAKQVFPQNLRDVFSMMKNKALLTHYL